VNHGILTVVPFAVLGTIMSIALWHDIRSRRIPNMLILSGTGAALLLHVTMPRGAGLFNVPAGSVGLAFSAGGFALGLLLLMPFYAMRTMGAGDVKLMAMVGAFLGPAGVAGATLMTMLCGGVLAMIVAIWSGQLTQVVVNLQQMIHGVSTRRDGIRVPQPVATSGKLAYAIAIACGTATHLMLAGSPAWRIFS
jgi:prepilin peptidase CpaA